MGDYFSSLDKLEEWKFHLDSHEELIAIFILNRTVRWRKDWESIPRRHFLGGVYTRDGRLITAPLSMSQTTLSKKITQLVELGLISVIESPPPKANQYKLNLSSPMPLSKPKRLQRFAKDQEGNVREPKNKSKKGAAETPSRSERNSDSEREKLYINREGKEEKVNKQSELTSRSVSELSEARKAKVEIVNKANAKRESLLSKQKLTMKEIKVVWQSELNALFPDNKAMSLPANTVHALRAKQEKWNESRRDETFAQFIRWTLENWGTILRVQLCWMTKNPPDPLRPDPWIIVSQMDSIYRLFEKRQTQWVKSADNYDPDSELHSRMSVGQSYEEAIQAIKDREEAERSGDRLRSLRDELRAIEGRMRYADPSERREAVRKARESIKQANNSVEL